MQHNMIEDLTEVEIRFNYNGNIKISGKLLKDYSWTGIWQMNRNLSSGGSMRRESERNLTGKERMEKNIRDSLGILRHISLAST